MLFLYKNQTDYDNLTYCYIYTTTKSTLIFYVNGRLARHLLPESCNFWGPEIPQLFFP